MHKHLGNSLKRLHKSERGSASVEFVLLAIPLFLPILIFLNHFAALSGSELISRTLVRESLRAYVTAPNNDVAAYRADQVMRIGAKAEGLTDAQINSMNLSFQCSATPCISPNGRIKATLKMELPNQNRTVTAQAEEYISPWQWNGEGNGVQLGASVDPKVALEIGIQLLKDRFGIPI